MLAVSSVVNVFRNVMVSDGFVADPAQVVLFVYLPLRILCTSLNVRHVEKAFCNINLPLTSAVKTVF